MPIMLTETLEAHTSWYLHAQPGWALQSPEGRKNKPSLSGVEHGPECGDDPREGRYDTGKDSLADAEWMFLLSSRKCAEENDLEQTRGLENIGKVHKMLGCMRYSLDAERALDDLAYMCGGNPATDFCISRMSKRDIELESATPLSHRNGRKCG